MVWNGLRNYLDSYDYRRYSFCAAYPLIGNNFSIGLTYNWFAGDDPYYKDLDSLAWSFTTRFGDYFSMGFKMRDVTRSTFKNIKLEKKYNIGFAIRPLGDSNLTLTFDSYFK